MSLLFTFWGGEIFIAKTCRFWYNNRVMKNRTHFYVSCKNAMTWLMTLCLVCSAVARILFVGGEGTDTWSQIVLPVVATLLYVLIALVCGKEQFYRTTIPFFLICLYYVFSFAKVDFYAYGKMITALYALVLFFLTILYGVITGGRFAATSVLLLIALIPYGVTVYLNRALITGDLVKLLPLLPDTLMTVGLVFMVFAIQIHPLGEFHPTWGDRSDGRKLRTLDPMSQVSPYIMRTRNSSSNLFSESFEITNVERYIRQKRRESMPNLGLQHILLTCVCRGVSRYPGINRFIAGQKVYTHGDDIQFCMTVKKEMAVDAPETVIKLHLSPADTLQDVYDKMNAAIEEVKNTPLDSAFDNVAHLFTLVPGIFLKFLVWVLRVLDYFGMLPKFLLEVSPFHGSVFFTSMGSLGIPPIYHHLYDFGNLPVFASFGCKRRAIEVQEDGTVVQKKYMDCRFTLDERTVDGFYYATFFKYFKRLMLHPEVLENPPEEIVRDID